jgi:hypothetical protein
MSLGNMAAAIMPDALQILKLHAAAASWRQAEGLT